MKTIIQSKQNILFFFILILCVLLLSSGCFNNQEILNTSEPPEEQVINNTTNDEPNSTENMKNSVIKIGTVHFPPFEVIDNGTFTGPGYDFTREAFKRMGTRKTTMNL